MKVLIIAPHADDEVLGTGGAIQWHKSNGDDVYVVVIANRIIDHKIDENYFAQTKQIAYKVKKLLKINEYFFCDLIDEHLEDSLMKIILAIQDKIDSIKPDIVYIPNKDDSNQDHRAVHQACRVTCRSVDKILMYEVPSSTTYFNHNFYIEITEEILNKKIEAMSYYKGETRDYPNPRSFEGLKVFAKMRGIESNKNFAESFITYKYIIN